MKKWIGCMGSLVSVLLLVGLSWGQQAPLAISAMKVEPASVEPGGKALISCRVIHAGGSGLIERVAATAFQRERTMGYTMLYDDGTHGDRVVGDGVYSLEIRSGDVSGEERIVFQALSKDRHEVESGAVILVVK
jgi:hypothetical protein